MSVQLADLLNADAMIRADHWSDVFPLGSTTIETLEEAASQYDYAVFLASGDDALTRRGEIMVIARDNVILEFGLFAGALGRERSLLIVPEGHQVTLPSDLRGVTVEQWRARDDFDPRAIMRPVADRLLRIHMAKGPRPRKIPLHFLTLNDLGREIPGFEERIATAESEILISGNDCKFAVESRSAHLRKALGRGVAIKILCADPSVPQLPEMLAVIDQRFETGDKFRSSMISVEQTLMGLRRGYPKLFEFKYLRVLPALGFFMTDAEKGGFVKVELYTPGPWEPLDTRPHFLVPVDDPLWRPYFINCWTNYWNAARDPFLDGSLGT